MWSKSFIRTNTIIDKPKSIYIVYYLFSIKSFLIRRNISRFNDVFYRKRLTQIRIVFMSIVLTKHLIIFTHPSTKSAVILLKPVKYSRF
nr:MAG TPA_asm: hypothetical protein [Caudoviricetes sp.]